MWLPEKVLSLRKLIGGSYMKKLLVILLIIALFLISLMSCGHQSTRPPTFPENSSPDSTSTPVESELEHIMPTVDLSDYCIAYVDDQIIEGASIYDGDSSKEYALIELKNSNAPKTYRLDFLGTEYELQYVGSARLRNRDIVVDDYETYLENGRKVRIWVNMYTGDIVKYIGFPYPEELSFSKQATEEQYREFISSLIDSQYDLTQYTQERETYYTVYGENYTAGKTCDYFKVCGENEKLKSYTFHYVRYIEGVVTNEHITATFSDSRFNLELYPLGYEPSDFDEFSSESELFDAAVIQYLKSNASRDLSKIEIASKSYFIVYGVPHIQYTLSAYYSVDETAQTEQRIPIQFVVRKK